MNISNEYKGFELWTRGNIRPFTYIQALDKY